MDPITGVSLVASVITLIDFGIKTAKGCHEIYEHGSAADLDGIDNTAIRLRNLSADLKSSTNVPRATKQAPISKEEKELVDLGKNAESVLISSTMS